MINCNLNNQNAIRFFWNPKKYNEILKNEKK